MVGAQWRRTAHTLSCCKVDKLLLHFIEQTIISVMQCAVAGPEDFRDVKKRGSQEAKLLAWSMQARCSASAAVAAIVSSG